jgi:hypothetical protein
MMRTDRTLRPNPYYTYRDPLTGRWITILPPSATSVYQAQKTSQTVRLIRQPVQTHQTSSSL